jgi:hypothetical protein
MYLMRAELKNFHLHITAVSQINNSTAFKAPSKYEKTRAINNK